MKIAKLKTYLIIALLALTLFTVYGVYAAGGILAMVRVHLNGPIGWQIFADLVIAIGLFVAWLWNDAKKLGRNFTFWAIFSLTCGSF